jgi:hypothetical protein
MSEPDKVMRGFARLAVLQQQIDAPLCLIGGAAMVARAFVRATQDFDVVVSASAWDVDRLLEAGTAAGYAATAVDRELAEAGILRWSDSTPRGMSIDLLLADTPHLEEVVRRGSSVDVPGLTVPVATLEDLVLLKLEALRPRDIDDVLAIKDVAAEQLDRDYLERWAKELGVLDRLTLYFGA